MLALQKQQKYFSRVVNMPDGTLALVFFELVFKDGRTVAKAVHVEILDQENIFAQEVKALPCIKTPIEFIPVRYFGLETVNSFLKDFSFVLSQPTRAPSIF